MGIAGGSRLASASLSFHLLIFPPAWRWHHLLASFGCWCLFTQAGWGAEEEVLGRSVGTAGRRSQAAAREKPRSVSSQVHSRPSVSKELLPHDLPPPPRALILACKGGVGEAEGGRPAASSARTTSATLAGRKKKRLQANQGEYSGGRGK